MPRVSVVIPTWNRAGWLAGAIDSVLRQRFADFEVCVVDDGSDDGTETVLSRYGKRIQVRRHSRNRGVSCARNTGIKQGDSEWIAFLDSDDRWHEDKLEKQMTLVEQRPGFLLHFTDEIWVREGVRVNPGKHHRKREGRIFQPSLALCLIAPSTVLIRRKLFDECGMFDETLPACEDYDLWLRITSRHPVALLNEKLMTRYGGHADQLSRSTWGLDRFRVQSLQKILEHCPLKTEDRAAAIRMLTGKCNILIQGFEKRGNLEEAQRYRMIRDSFL